MDDDQTCPESVLLVAMERAFRGPEYTGTQTRDWQPHMKRVLQCVRENDPMIEALRTEIERLRTIVGCECSECQADEDRAAAEYAALQKDALRYREIVADVHTCGPTCRKTPACAERADLREEIERLCAQVAALQARVDALMLEFCPEEMSAEQVAEWARHQRPASETSSTAPCCASSCNYEKRTDK